VTQNLPIARSADPNGKITTGYGNQGYIPPNATITYTIYFENQSSATAPAAAISVTDVLDPNLDPSTVQLSQMGFNNVTLSIPGALQSYTTQTSVSTSPYPVAVNASLNPGTGTLTWTMQSIDPTTGAAPADPLAGFLPPDNTSKQGEGFVIFTVQPKGGLANGTTIQNTASIVFDKNAAINTNTVTNTIDSVYPTSSVNPLPATTSTASFTVSWSGSDPAGAGIATYDIYSATDNGPYTVWQSGTAATSATFDGALGHTYSFYSMATDNAGKRQQTPGPSQSTTTQGQQTKVPPTVVVTPLPSSIAAAQSLSVTVTVSGGTGYPIPTGSVTLSGGGYTSAATTLNAGSATMNISAGSLDPGSDALTAIYLPDTNSAATFTMASGSASIAVTGDLVWIVDGTGGSSELSGTGGGLTSGASPGLNMGMAIDRGGNIWSIGSGTPPLEETSTGGVVESQIATGTGGLDLPVAIAIDGNSNIWTANGNNSISLISNAGAALSPANGFTASSLSTPSGIAIDLAGSVWIANKENSSVTRILGGAAPVAPPATAIVNGTTGAKP
jgi:uncharacterized repeat protein (TIGR01451 family)